MSEYECDSKFVCNHLKAGKCSAPAQVMSGCADLGKPIKITVNPCPVPGRCPNERNGECMSLDPCIHQPDTWESLKQDGSSHYKVPGGVEPIDLYRAGGAFDAWALCSIIKYCFRNLRQRRELFDKDMDKIIDLARKLKAAGK